MHGAQILQKIEKCDFFKISILVTRDFKNMNYDIYQLFSRVFDKISVFFEHFELCRGRYLHVFTPFPNDILDHFSTPKPTYGHIFRLASRKVSISYSKVKLDILSRFWTFLNVKISIAPFQVLKRSHFGVQSSPNSQNIAISVIFALFHP